MNDKDKKFWKIYGIGFIICIVFIASVIAIDSVRSQIKYTVPNVVGMTVSEARAEFSKANVNISVYSAGNENEIVQSQSIVGGKKVTRSTTVTVETKEYAEKKKQEEEERSKVEPLIKAHAERVRDANSGNAWYSGYSYYGTSKNGEKIYRINYNSSYNNSSYTVTYYQLVSIDKNYKYITNYTSLFHRTSTGGKEVTNDNNQMKWEAEKLWGI